MPTPQPVEAPSESDRQLMNTLDITFLDGVYQLGAYMNGPMPLDRLFIEAVRRS